MPVEAREVTSESGSAPLDLQHVENVKVLLDVGNDPTGLTATVLPDQEEVDLGVQRRHLRGQS